MNPHESGDFGAVVAKMIATHLVQIEDLTDRIERLESRITSLSGKPR